MTEGRIHTVIVSSASQCGRDAGSNTDRRRKGRPARVKILDADALDISLC